jgi:3-deoxy-D-manno-octulosonic-acid transferase
VISKLAGDSSKIIYMGNFKFTNRSPVIVEKITHLLGNKKIFLIASTHTGEEDFFVKCSKSFMEKFDHIIIAPRHIARIKEVETLLLSYNIEYTLISKVISNNSLYTKFAIIDILGLLETMYSISDKIFIGGSLVNIGGHNIYEALQFKKTISTGPCMDNFKDIYDLAIKYKLLHIIKDEKDLLDYLFNNYDNKASFDLFFEELLKVNNRIITQLTQLAIDETKIV